MAICSLCDKPMRFWQSKIFSNLVMHEDWWKEEVHSKCHYKDKRGFGRSYGIPQDKGEPK